MLGTVAQRLAPKGWGKGGARGEERHNSECLFDADTMQAIDDLVDNGAADGMQSIAAATSELMSTGAIDLRGALTVNDNWARRHAALEARGILV